MMKQLQLNKKTIMFIITLLIISGCETNPFTNSSTSNSIKTSINKPTTISSMLFRKLVNEELKIDLNEKGLESQAYQAVGLPVAIVPTTLKQAILDHERDIPTPSSQKVGVFGKCQFIGTRIELDDRQPTAEWLVTPDSRCSSRSPNKVKTYWVIQKAQSGKLSVLIADRGKTLSIWKKDKAPLRFIMTDIEITQPSKFTKKPVPVMCHKSWTYISGKYVSKYAGVEVYKDDPMSPYPQWIPVSGTDSLTNIDENFQCSAK